MLVKVFRLLEILADRKGGMRLSQVSQATGIAKPTAHRNLRLLTQMGYVERVETGHYRLGQRLIQLVMGQEIERLVRCAEPVLMRLQEATGETVNLGVLRQDRVVYAMVRESSHPLRRVSRPMESHPFHSTALGRAIAAFTDEPQQAALIESAGLVKRTRFTVSSPANLRAILQEVRRQGYSIEENETDIGAMCIGAPVFDRGRIVGAISVSVPSARVDAAERIQLVQSVLAAAQQLSLSLGRLDNTAGMNASGKE